MTLDQILLAIITGLAVNECCDISPWLAHKLVRWSAHRRYTSPSRAEVRAEELAAYIDARPGKLFKLTTALSFVAVAVVTRKTASDVAPPMPWLLTTLGIRRVPSGYLGVVDRRFGRWHEGDRNFGEVRAHGSPGIQAETLKSNHRYLLPRPLYRVRYVPRIKVPPGTIGVVVAKDGTPPPQTRTLSKHVECDNFQDGRAFLLNGGQRGRQPGVLPGDASYAINPELFEVITADTIGTTGMGRADLTAAALMEIRIPEGTTGVVVVYEGEKHNKVRGSVGRRVPGHESFQLPSVFLDNQGQQGVQQETLSSGGVYRINPWFAQVELVPTRVLVLEWNNEKKSSGSFDATLDQIRINVEGHWLRFDLSQTISIPPEAAPRLVSEFGQQEPDRPDANPVRRFVDRVLGPLVQGYFQTSFGEYEILSFVSRADTVCRELETLVRQVLDVWGIEAVRTELNNFESEGTALDELRRSLAEVRDRDRFSNK